MATVTEPRQKAKVKTLPAPLKIERLDVPLPEGYVAWIEAGQLDNTQWCWGMGANGDAVGTSIACRLREGEAVILSRPQAFAEGLRALAMFADAQKWPAEAKQQISALRVADWNTLVARIEGRLVPPELPSLARNGRASREASPEKLNPEPRTLNPLSTVTPTGIAANDPDVEKRPPIGHHGRRKPSGWINDRDPRYRLAIDPQFRDACRPLSDDERKRLRENIAQRGCLQPGIAWWDGSKLLLVDGHHRWQICQELDEWFELLTVEFADRRAVLDWIAQHQAGRRNLTPAERDELLARDYAAEVAARKASGKNGAHGEPQPAAPHGAAVCASDPRMNEHGVYTEGIKKVNVPLPSTSRCTALIRLVEQLDGTWVYGHVWKRSGTTPGCGGESSPPTDRDAFGTRLDALRDAGKNLLRHAQRSTSGPWPANAIKAIKAWQALPQNGGKQKAAAVVAEKHGVSPATVKRAAKAQRAREKLKQAGESGEGWSREEIEGVSLLSVDDYKRALAGGQNSLREAGRKAAKAAKKVKYRTGKESDLRREATRHIERYLDSLADQDQWQQSEYLLDALNQWRGRNKPSAPRLGLRGGMARRGRRQSQGKAKRRPR